jgi:hypothetical protein
MDSFTSGSRIDSAGRGIASSAPIPHPRLSGLQSAVNRLTSAGASLAPPREIREWTGDARSGQFVQIDATTCALDVGRGCYITVDIQRDLNGIIPNEAKRCILCRSGAVREPDSRRSYNAQ